MNDIEIGKSFEFSNTFTNDDVFAFAEITEDDNPIHINDSYASNSIFGKRVVHGILVTSMFSKIFGTIYPGNGGIYLSQTAKFLMPVFINEKILAKVTLRNFDYSKNRGTFTTECFNSKGDFVLTGEAKILFPQQMKMK